MNRVQIKERAKSLLGNNLFGNIWLMAVLVCFISTAAISVAGSLLPGLGTILISGPISYGLAWVFLGLARGSNDVKIEDLFKGFTNDFVKNFVLGFMISLFTALWSLLFIIPGIIKGLAYSMAFYIRLDHPEYDWRTCINQSERMMEGHKADLFVQQLSFIGWILIGSLLCGIGVLWVTPYISLSQAVFYEDVKAKYEASINAQA